MNCGLQLSERLTLEKVPSWRPCRENTVEETEPNIFDSPAKAYSGLVGSVGTHYIVMGNISDYIPLSPTNPE